MSAPAVGIDLGTTYSCVAVFRNGSVEVIPNELGNRTMPSVVAFTAQGRLVGEAAKDQDYNNPENTIYDAKRLIGRKFDDENVHADREKWPFKVIDVDGRPKIRVTYEGEDKTYHPEEISAMVLGALKAAAAAHLGVEVTRCVVTVPAHFSDAQRQATRDAAAIAGLKVLRIINEPTAGALAYGLGSDTADEERNILIYDLGGGTFDVSVLCIEEGVFEVRASAGDTHLGGQDFDTRLCSHLAKEFTEKNPETNILDDKKAMLRLQNACEKAKRQLSASVETTMQLDNLHAKIDFSTTITRASFEKLNQDLFRLTIDLVEKALKDAELTKDQINEVVLVGGSTRIPLVQQLLSDFFDNKELNKSMNPDEAVARGAAVQAAILDSDQEDTVLDLVLIDVAQQSLGVGVIGGTVTTLIPRGAVLPACRTKTFTTAVDRQSAVLIQVFEGERALGQDNNLLGKFTLRNLPPVPRGEIQIEVTFEVNTDGILNVSAKELTSGQSGSITITNDRNRLSTLEIERLVMEAASNRTKDDELRETAQSRARLEHYCFSVKSRVENKKNKDKLPGPQKHVVLNKCAETIKWLDGNATASQTEYKKKLKEIEAICEPVIKILA